MDMPDRKSVTLQEPVQARAQSPYRLREHFLSTPERALLQALQKVAGERYLICPKVALNEIFYIVRPNENVHFFNKFFRKHVDFLLCDSETLKPAIGIELVKPTSRRWRPLVSSAWYLARYDSASRYVGFGSSVER